MHTDQALREFMSSLMSIKDMTMGGAWSGIAGGVTPQSTLIAELRQTSLAFSAAYERDKTDELLLEKLADRLSGSLQSLQLLNVLDAVQYETLLAQLQDLMKVAQQR